MLQVSNNKVGDLASDVLDKFKEFAKQLTPRNISLKRAKVKRVTKVKNDAPTDVYDIGMKNDNHPWFFANNMLVHNSVYFSAYPIFKPQIASGEFNWDKDTIIELYDAISAQVNSTFPAYMEKAHNCPERYGRIIAGAREAVAERGIFISKKRYGLLVYDNKGIRVDTDGKRGKLDVKGLEIKRSDTPEYMQEFLKEILQSTLEGATEENIVTRIREFRKEFRAMAPWEKGTPKRVNNLTKYTREWNKTSKCRVGHVMAAINWNRLRDMNSDQYSMEIVDGMKTIVCRLKPNPLGIASIGIPTDEKRIPEWYQDLPFDDNAMEEVIITKKISNLLGTLKWDLTRAETKTTFNDLFDF